MPSDSRSRRHLSDWYGSSEQTEFGTDDGEQNGHANPQIGVPHVDGQSSPLEASTIKAGGAANRAAHFRVGALGSSLMPSSHVHSRATGPNHWIHAN
jgi:hypothetical protein